MSGSLGQIDGLVAASQRFQSASQVNTLRYVTGLLGAHLTAMCHCQRDHQPDQPVRSVNLGFMCNSSTLSQGYDKV